MIIKKVGFFGLGDMGAAISQRLLIKGYKILSTKRGKYKNFLNNKNFILKDNPCDVAVESDIIIFCVDTIKNLNQIIFSKKGILKANKIPKFILDLTTGKPSNCEYLSKVFIKKNKFYIDMPIGRTPAHAKEGKINLFISSKEKKLKECNPLIKAISENQFYVDNIGEGTKIKLLNNFYGQSITLIFGKLLKNSNKKNVNINNLVKIMSAGPLKSDILTAIKPYYEYDYKGAMEFSINNAYTDLIYFKEEFGSDKLVNLIIRHFKFAVKKGHGKKSVANVSKFAYF